MLTAHGCILYADDILLLSPSVIGLQAMLDKCAEVAKVLLLESNVEKSHCVVIGKKCASNITPIIKTKTGFSFSLL